MGTYFEAFVVDWSRLKTNLSTATPFYKLSATEVSMLSNGIRHTALSQSGIGVDEDGIYFDNAYDVQSLDAIKLALIDLFSLVKSSLVFNGIISIKSDAAPDEVHSITIKDSVFISLQ